MSERYVMTRNGTTFGVCHDGTAHIRDPSFAAAWFCVSMCGDILAPHSAALAVAESNMCAQCYEMGSGMLYTINESEDVQ